MPDRISPAATSGATAPILVPISAAELIDKITILEIKRKRIREPAKLKNIESELSLLEQARDNAVNQSEEVLQLSAELRRVNEALWEIENEIRVCERDGDFGERFIDLARSVYRNNDDRSALKRAINKYVGSTLIEEKSYTHYDAGGTNNRMP